MSYYTTDLEIKEWIDSLRSVASAEGSDQVRLILEHLGQEAERQGINPFQRSQTPYTNTISVSAQPTYPGDTEIEQKIENIIRWNAMAMVVKANQSTDGIGGHISTYASSATLYETGFHHFFRGKDHPEGGDIIYYQGHASPGIYARSFLEGRFSTQKLSNFRRELAQGGGLSSYPHPWLMPDYWEYPTVSMGLGPITAIYQARFNKYLENRGLANVGQKTVWAFLGDGETDEPESLGALSVASREGLDNLIFVINCNLQRLDGPVRGNGNIVRDLEGQCRGAGWNVIRALWSSHWDELLERDHGGYLHRKLDSMVDGEFQKMSVSSGAQIREMLCQENTHIEKLLAKLSDPELKQLSRAGHDREKVYAAYHKAKQRNGKPTVILVQTVKGFGLGQSGQGQNSTHQKKKLDAQTIEMLRDQWEIPISKDRIQDIPFYQPDKSSLEIQYLLDKRKELGGFLPYRKTSSISLSMPESKTYSEFDEGTGDREVSTTMVMVRILSKLLKDKELGKHIVPIVPDEARTFGMEAFFSQIGIYSPKGQLYEPVDAKSLLYYKESKKGALLEEGITEAGAMSSFIAAGTSHNTHQTPMIPFYLYYSMFGLQRIGDLAWSAADQQCRGFLVGATAGRTTLAGEGLQHQDGHSHLLAYPIPTLKAYDPAFAFELSCIVEHGIKEMYHEQKNVFYYITVGNENYQQPVRPNHVSDQDILDGMYCYEPSSLKGEEKSYLFGSAITVNESLKAKEILEKQYNIPCEVWSITSYKNLYVNALECERHNALQIDQEPKASIIEQKLAGKKGVFIASSDYVKTLPNSIGKYFPADLHVLGTDGFGRSESREALRDFFEIDAKAIVYSTLYRWHILQKFSKQDLLQARKDLRIQLRDDPASL
ncbi:MAG: pyruvate dehydrogenase (acetyl-transferring), homodimeric type [Bdellovibrionales bacterium]|nr:pyruvate dehydrogenase (acetyl-transferring), homodimeric type [Bdellovibrionales bacterium]